MLKLCDRHLLLLYRKFFSFISNNIVKNHTDSVWVKVMNFSRVHAAAPLAIVFCANSTPAASDGARSPAYKAAAAFRTTISRRGPGTSAHTSRMIEADS